MFTNGPRRREPKVLGTAVLEQGMRREDYLPWFEDLSSRAEAITPKPRPGRRTVGGKLVTDYSEEEVLQWATEAESALAALFPISHPCRKTWKCVAGVRSGLGGKFTSLRGVFNSALALIKDDRLGSLIVSIRVESESELLEQAETLAEADHLAAAAVIAGGALETHLRHLVVRNGLPISGHGSISAYNQAIVRARKAGTAIYSKAESDLIESWGKTRNDAAHDPGNFKHTQDQVKYMIEGVRQFISRVN